MMMGDDGMGVYLSRSGRCIPASASEFDCPLAVEALPLAWSERSIPLRTTIGEGVFNDVSSRRQDSHLLSQEDTMGTEIFVISFPR